MYTLHADVEFSRRKRLHHITDNLEDPVWSGAKIFDAFQWFLDNQRYTFELRQNGETIRVMIGRTEG